MAIVVRKRRKQLFGMSLKRSKTAVKMQKESNSRREKLVTISLTYCMHYKYLPKSNTHAYSVANICRKY